jgi:hypothetical protein
VSFFFAASAESPASLGTGIGLGPLETTSTTAVLFFSRVEAFGSVVITSPLAIFSSKACRCPPTRRLLSVSTVVASATLRPAVLGTA